MNFNAYLEKFESIIKSSETTEPLKSLEDQARNDLELNYRQRDSITARCLNFRINNWAKPARKIV